MAHNLFFSLPKGIEQFFKQVEGILSVEDVDKLSEKINLVGKDFRIEPYFEVIRYSAYYDFANYDPFLPRRSLKLLERNLNW